jgi:bifunctional UDP-N-acetylglucosamine pyrophosphorylase/glucosamine-1-phosphate N-acetyltransferase
MRKRPLVTVILAAGKGTRMRSAAAKVLHPLLGRPMLAWVLDLARAVDRSGRKAVVVGHMAEEVSSCVPPREFEIVLQKSQLGTGHALRQAEALFQRGKDVLVLSGDTPLLTAGTLRRLLAAHRRGKAAVTLLTAVTERPKGYGRIIRGKGRSILAVREEADASPAERRLGEINTGTYCFDGAFLARALRRLGRKNRQGEYYLTDVVALAVEEGLAVRGFMASHAEETLGINSRAELAAAQGVLKRRKLEGLMKAGVTVVDPSTTWVEEKVTVGADTVLLPMTFLEGETRIGRNCRIGPMARVRNSRIGRGVHIRDSCVIESSKAGDGCIIGPFSHLRPGSELARGVKVGNFVEVKGSRIGKGSKANHLSYIGDAEIGREVNIGAGTITCNYDGMRKWRTVIEDGAFIGSNTELVAPVRIGRGALVGAGSTVTRDVPPGSLAVSRVPQENRRGHGERRLRERRKRS